MELSALHRWFLEAKRSLPWRSSPDPYGVWLSEVMSQQTTLKAVGPYYLRFRERFPTVESLAASPLEEVLELWSGLGYYRRARYLHAAAKLIGTRGFPSSARELRELPGIGPYTAAAIASIAFGEATPVVDGNVERVLSRQLGLSADPKRGEGRKAIANEAARLMNEASDPSLHNQSLMELGALLCRPGALAQCEACPVSESCVAKREGRVAELPRSAPRPRVTPRLDHALAIRDGAALLYGEIPADAVWGGLLELPRMTVSSESSARDSALKIARALLGCGARLLSPEPIARARTAVMSERVTLLVFAAELDAPPRPLQHARIVWLNASEAERARLPAPQRRVCRDCFVTTAELCEASLRRLPPPASRSPRSH